MSNADVYCNNDDNENQMFMNDLFILFEVLALALHLQVHFFLSLILIEVLNMNMNIYISMQTN